MLPFFLFTLPAAAQSVPVPLKVKGIASGLIDPVGLTAAPRDPSRLFVIEKGGAIRLIKNGQLLNTPFLDLGGQVAVSGERGLLGIAFHPRYAQNGYFYVNYTRISDSATVVERYQCTSNPDVADPASVLPLITIAQPFDNHNGGCLAFSPIDRYLYIATGDGGSGGDPFGTAQNLMSPLGKMLRIDVDHFDAGKNYSVPSTNPFYNTPGAVQEIYALGLRNPWRFTFDPDTGDMYIGDVGQDSIEEIDFIGGNWLGGQNFGWNCMEGFQCTNYTTPNVCTCNHPSLTMPIHTYPHTQGCAVIGGEFYRGSVIPSLDGFYIFSDICKTRNWILKYDGTQIVDFQDRFNELLPPPGAHTISSMGRDANGELYYVYLSGHIGKLVPADESIPGVASFGQGTPGCHGAHTLTVNVPCAPGTWNVQFLADNAPPLTPGFLMIGDSRLAEPGVDVFGVGASVLVDFFNSNYVIAVDMQADENGMAEVHFDLPNNPFVAGLTFYNQAAFYFGGPCLPASATGFGTTNGLAITMQQ